MRTFSGKPKANQPGKSSASLKSGRVISPQSRNALVALHLRRMIDNRTLQRFPEADARDVNEDPTIETGGFAHGFGRISADSNTPEKTRTISTVNTPGGITGHETVRVAQRIMPISASEAHPPVIQRETAEPEEDDTQCTEQRDITADVHRFRNEVIRQIGRNSALRDTSLPNVPPLSQEELIARITETRPHSPLINPANETRARIALNVLSDEPGFSFASAEFFTCEAIDLPQLRTQPGQQFEGFVDPNRTPVQVFYLRSFKDSILQFLAQNDQDALREVLELIAHEKRHVTLAGNAPTVDPLHMQPDAEADVDIVNYNIEEILTTAEEIAVNALFDPQYVVPDRDTYRLLSLWRVIRQSVDSTRHAPIRARIQELLRSRYGGDACDNAISTGVLTAMARGQWYTCREGLVINPPDGVTPCMAPGGETHNICG